MMALCLPQQTIHHQMVYQLDYHKEESVCYQGPAFSINSAGGGTWEGVKAEIEKNGWTSLK